MEKDKQLEKFKLKVRAVEQEQEARRKRANRIDLLVLIVLLLITFLPLAAETTSQVFLRCLSNGIWIGLVFVLNRTINNKNYVIGMMSGLQKLQLEVVAELEEKSEADKAKTKKAKK
jgi:hypothetical protein